MELRVSSCGNICLSLGNLIPIFCLEQPNTKDLVGLHLCNAHRDWRDNGNVSFRSHHDRSEHGGVRSWTYSHGALHNQPTAPESCFVKIDLDGREFGQSRYCPTQFFCWYLTCLPKTTAPGIVSRPVNPEDSAAVPTRPTDWRLDTCS